MTDKSIELALSVLKAEKDNLTPDHLQQLAELTDAGEGVRTDVKGTLETTVKRKLSPEQADKPADTAELIKKLELEAQYGARLDTLRHYGFLDESGETRKGDVKNPTFEKAMSTFKPEELEIASHFQKPTLLLVPEISFAAKVKAMDAHKQGMQKNKTYVNKAYRRTDSGSYKITGWRAVIVDGAQKMVAYDGDDFDLRFDKRIEARKAARKTGEKGMDRHRYALLMMEAIRNGNPVDKELYTLLDDDPALSDSDVPNANFYPGYRRVDFRRDDSDNVDGDARFRSSVGGDVLLS